MKIKGINSTVIAIFIAALFQFLYYFPQFLLADIYNWYSTISQDIVVLMMNAPSLISTIACMLMPAILKRLNKKLLIVSGLGINLFGGILIVTTAGKFFAASLTGCVLSGLAGAILSTTANVALMEASETDEESVRNIAICSAIGGGGTLLFSPLAGALAQDGNWVRSYWLFLAIIPALILVFALYRSPAKKNTDSSTFTPETATENKPTKLSTFVNLKGFLIIFFLYFIFNVAIKAYQQNYSTYIVTEKAIGTSMEASLISTIGSAAMLIGGFFFSGLAVKWFKQYTVTVGWLIYAAALLIFAVGVTSLPVIYAASFIRMFFYQATYGCCVNAIGKAAPGGTGVSLLTAGGSIASFVGGYIVDGLANLFGGYYARFWVGAIMMIICAIVIIPIMKKSEKWGAEQ